MAAYSKYANEVHKISIIPRGRAALGYTLQVPAEDQFLLTYSELFDHIKGLLGGRASEEIVFDEVSTGAENDLEQATILARQMVCLYGMSSAVGLLHCGQRPRFYPLADEGISQNDCSEQTIHEVDLEVTKLLNSAYQQAKDIIVKHRPMLETVAKSLIEHETLDKDTFLQLLDHQSDIQHTVDGKKTKTDSRNAAST